MSDDLIDLDDGRAPLPPPTHEALVRAAEEVLGRTAQEALFDDGSKLFRGINGFFLQGPDESVGIALPQADRTLQDKLVQEAARCRRAAAEGGLAMNLDPSKNPMIKFGTD